MHPMMKPALRRGWRGGHTLQVGVTRAHAVELHPVDTATGMLLERLDGTRGMELLRAEAHRLGLDPRSVDELIARLTAAGVIDEGPPLPSARTSGDPVDAVGGTSTPGSGAAAGGGAVPARLWADRAALSVVHPEPGAAVARLAARRRLRVQVRGAGRVGATVAALLSAAGVGEVEVLDGGCVEPWDVSPGGLAPDDVGRRREAAARSAVRRAAAEPPPARGAVSGPVALVVLAPRDGLAAYAPDPAVAEPYRAAGTPHVYAGVLEGTGVVGPLVLPGGSACAGCLAAGRAEREPDWPRMLAQWRRGGSREGASACDVALATMVAGLAAAHVLTFLDGRLPVLAGARLECALPGLAWELTELDAHPQCGCGAAAAADLEAGVAHV